MEAVGEGCTSGALDLDSTTTKRARSTAPPFGLDTLMAGIRAQAPTG